jgi:hypothetical protein
MSGVEEVTTYSAFKRHLAWPKRGVAAAGRVGRGLALCGTASDTEYYDQAALDAVRAKYNAAYEQIRISSLPLCARCAVWTGGAP